MNRPTKGIAVDGGCSKNPGQAYYRAVDIATEKELFRYDIGEATNNIAEFLAVCNAIHYRNITNSNLAIYSDSITAIAWVKNKKANSSYTNNYIAPRIKKAEEFLKTLDNVPKIQKWLTKEWGEIPADFGLKK
jgi:ribonuclease HI